MEEDKPIEEVNKPEREKITRESHPEYFNENGRFLPGNKVGVRLGHGQVINEKNRVEAFKKSWEQKRFRKQLFQELATHEIKVKDGRMINFLQAFIDQLKFVMLAPDSEVEKAGYEPLTINEKINHFIKLIERITPDEQNVKITSDMPVQITFNSNDKNAF